MDVAKLYWSGATGLLHQLVRDAVVEAPLKRRNGSFGKGSEHAESPQVVVITGAGRGIGEAMARQLAAQGHAVIASCVSPDTDPIRQVRDVPLYHAADVLDHDNGALADLPSALFGSITLTHLDYRDLGSVQTFATTVFRLSRHVDCVVHNAGVMLCPFSLCSSGLEEHVQVNVLGPYLLTLLILKNCEQASANWPLFLLTTSITHACEPLDLSYLTTHSSYRFTTSPASSTHSFSSSSTATASAAAAYRPHRSYMQTKLAALMVHHALRRRHMRTAYDAHDARADGRLDEEGHDGGLAQGRPGHYRQRPVFAAGDPGIVNTSLYRHTPGVFQWLQRLAGRVVMRSPDAAARCILAPFHDWQLQAREPAPHYAFAQPWEPAQHVHDQDLQDQLLAWLDQLVQPYLKSS